MSEKQVRKVTTPIGRLSFPALFKPETFEDGGDPKFSATLLFPKGSTDLKALQDLAKEAAAKAFPNGLPPNFRNPFRDGDREKPGVDGYQNVIFVKFSSTRRPKVVDLNLQEILNQDDVYAGCWVRVSCGAYGYDKKGNKGVSFNLYNVQKVKEGESFGATSSPEDDFFDSPAVAAEHQSFDFGANAQPSGNDPFAL